MKPGMTVAEVIEELETKDPDAKVFFTYQYGDHSRTEAAVMVDDVDERYVKEWPYGSCHRVVEDDEAEDAGVELVVVMRG